jgi:hypothetical protein
VRRQHLFAPQRTVLIPGTLLAILHLTTACTAEPQSHRDEWTGSDYKPIVAPSCPAPGTPQATSYQSHGGSSNALNWWLLHHALRADSTQHQDVHHHHGEPSATSRGGARTPATSTRLTAQPVPAIHSATTPRPSAPGSSGAAQPTATPPIPKPTSYGFRASTARPSPTARIRVRGR